MIAPDYYKEPITTLDWKSLYPSIMMAHNLVLYTFAIKFVHPREVVSHNVRKCGTKWNVLNEPPEPKRLKSAQAFHYNLENDTSASHYKG